jgi:hypothetical protein
MAHCLPAGGSLILTQELWLRNSLICHIIVSTDDVWCDFRYVVVSSSTCYWHSVTTYLA